MGRLADGAHSKIEQLPETQRKKVVDAILEGQSLRSIAKLAGISHVQVALYKQRVILPAVRAARKVHALQQLEKPNKPTSVSVGEQANLTREIVAVSPFRERLEKLWVRTDRALDKAESAVKTVKVNGEDVAVGQDLTPMAPLINQGHKNLELLGRVTGELEVKSAANIAIQIVMPSSAPSVVPDHGQTIDIAPIAVPYDFDAESGATVDLAPSKR